MLFADDFGPHRCHGCTDPRDRDLPPPVKVKPVRLAPGGDVFVRGLRALLAHVETGDAAALTRAVSALDDAARPRAARPWSRELRVKRGLYQALAHERSGRNQLRDRMVAAGLFTLETYRFKFHGALARLEDVLRMQLQQEDDASLRYLRQALARYGQENGGLHPRTLDSLVPAYIKAVPRDPACPNRGYARRYALLGGGRFYTLPPCSRFERAGASTSRKVYDTEEEYRVYSTVIGADMDRRRLRTLPRLVKLARLSPGHVAADVGAGPGLFSWPLAEVVGSTGKVYAAEINRSVTAYLRYVAARKPKLKVVPHRCTPADVKLPAGTVDVAFVIQTYHTMVSADPGDQLWFKEELKPWLGSIRRALKPGGRLVIQESADRVAPGTVRRHLGKVGLRHQQTETVAGGEFIAVFVKP